MRSWEFHRDLDPAAPQPLFVQLVRAITDDITGGRLTPGQRLPGSRTLARSLGVHRNTVLAAYSELAAEGWIVTRVAQATVVADTPPSLAPPRAAVSGAAGYDLPALADPHAPSRYPPGTLILARAAPDVRLLPARELAAAYRRVLLRHGSSLLFYGDAQGHPRLREALATMLAETRGIAARRETVLVTRGSQMAIDVIARMLVGPGDRVAVEAIGHPLVWAALRRAGAELVPVPVDRDGLDVAALARALAVRPIRALHVTPHHQFPTTAVMPAARRRELLALARTHRFAIIEDDYDHEFHFEARPVSPLASADQAGVVIYVGTLSKILAPGLRLGFVVAPPPVIERLVAVRVGMDLQGDQAIECAVADLFEDGEVQRHVRRMRQIYHARRDALVTALRRELAGAVDAEVPAGGMALWARVADAIDIDAWAAAGLEHGVAFRSARYYDLGGAALPYTRLSFTFQSEPELAEAVRRMARALGRAGSRGEISRTRAGRPRRRTSSRS
ncbi:MAG TPA: PLP-dependent aminotransferase family protein [Kofleriaceae bacterium]|jgi:GntR family transcriptional regulator/MocR family aminotransferase|nr:PLP-dependent aminotransferase family protein [Kofleriaceae bacterium]